MELLYYLAVEEQRMEAFAKAREEYQQLEILYGIEIGNAMDCPAETRQFLESKKI